MTLVSSPYCSYNDLLLCNNYALIFLCVLLFTAICSLPYTFEEFAQERTSTILTVPKLHQKLDPDHVSWFFNGTKLAIGYPHWKPEPEIETPYKSKVEFNNTDYSLKLKNLLKNDSGCYHIEIKLPQCKVVYDFYLTVKGK